MTLCAPLSGFSPSRIRTSSANQNHTEVLATSGFAERQLQEPISDRIQELNGDTVPLFYPDKTAVMAAGEDSLALVTADRYPERR